MSTHNICLHGEMRYQHFSDENSALSVAMIIHSSRLPGYNAGVSI